MGLPSRWARTAEVEALVEHYKRNDTWRRTKHWYETWRKTTSLVGCVPWEDFTPGVQIGMCAVVEVAREDAQEPGF